MRRAFLLLGLLIGVHTFHILRKTKSKNHQEITRTAILRATAKACNKTPAELTSEALAKVCGYTTPKNFENAIQMISYHNVMTDLDHPLSAKHHFDNEEFTAGKQLITTGIDEIVAFVKETKFDDARKKLGEILHTLQDFYSHSNWIELGNTEPCTALINPEENITNTAEGSQATCETNCLNDNCGAKILAKILNERVLTSGYFGISKPTGKCSHGGTIDFTTGIRRSWDGINKDYSDSSHGDKHNDAAKIAIDASVQLLEKIRGEINKENEINFLRLMGIHPSEPKGTWKKKKISFISFTSRYPDATEDVTVDVV